jgi:integrase
MSTNQNTNPENPFRYIFETYYDTNAERGKESVKDQIWDGEVAIVPWLKENGIEPTGVNEEQVKDYFRDLRDTYRANTQWEYARKIRFIYDKFQSRGIEGFDANPFEIVLEDHEILDPVYEDDARIYEIEVVREFLNELHPLNFAITMVMIKTTRRIGGTCNLDMCDVNLDHPGADWDVVSQLRGKPDHIYFSPKPEAGEKFRGQPRLDSAKSESKTVIPIDNELKYTLIWYLSMRRSSKNTGPVFTQDASVEHARRATRNSHGTQVRQVAKDLGYWYEPYDPDNIKPHYWRHWTTSIMKDKLTDSIVDYFRGDTGTTSDGYNHYTEAKAEAWLDNIPKIYPHYK